MAPATVGAIATVAGIADQCVQKRHDLDNNGRYPIRMSAAIRHTAILALVVATTAPLQAQTASDQGSAIPIVRATAETVAIPVVSNDSIDKTPEDAPQLEEAASALAEMCALFEPVSLDGEIILAEARARTGPALRYFANSVNAIADPQLPQPSAGVADAGENGSGPDASPNAIAAIRTTGGRSILPARLLNAEPASPGATQTGGTLQLRAITQDGADAGAGASAGGQSAVTAFFGAQFVRGRVATFDRLRTSGRLLLSRGVVVCSCGEPDLPPPAYEEVNAQDLRAQILADLSRDAVEKVGEQFLEIPVSDDAPVCVANASGAGSTCWSTTPVSAAFGSTCAESGGPVEARAPADAGNREAARVYTAEDIVAALGRIDDLVKAGLTEAAAARASGVRAEDHADLRQKYGGMSVEQVRHLRRLEAELARLRALVAGDADGAQPVDAASAEDI